MNNYLATLGKKIPIFLGTSLSTWQGALTEPYKTTSSDGGMKARPPLVGSVLTVDWYLPENTWQLAAPKLVPCSLHSWKEALTKHMWQTWNSLEGQTLCFLQHRAAWPLWHWVTDGLRRSIFGGSHRPPRVSLGKIKNWPTLRFYGLVDKGIDSSDLPLRSPHLNPTETLWAINITQPHCDTSWIRLLTRFLTSLDFNKVINHQRDGDFVIHGSSQQISQCII